MRLGLLYSGGKDSTLAAILLDTFYDVTLVTGRFGLTGDWQHARETATAIGFPFERVKLDREVLATATDRVVEDGYPRNGIQRIHEHALDTVADMDFDAVADGTRRDDRVPSVSRAQAQSLEDRHDVDYLSPLSGFGRSAVDRLVDDRLDVESGPSESITRADYESELRAAIAERYDPATVGEVFPDHEQTYVRGLR